MRRHDPFEVVIVAAGLVASLLLYAGLVIIAFHAPNSLGGAEEFFMRAATVIFGPVLVAMWWALLRYGK